jgi:hypothetical protein
MAHFEPADHYQRQLVQQLADSDWGIHQIFLLQSATISYMQGLSLKLDSADPEAAAGIEASDARAVRKLATLNSYENRKRRASKLLRQQIDELALEVVAKPMETKHQPEIGFVYPASESKAPEVPNSSQNRTTVKPQPGRNAPCQLCKSSSAKSMGDVRSFIVMNSSVRQQHRCGACFPFSARQDVPC